MVGFGASGVALQWALALQSAALLLVWNSDAWLAATGCRRSLYVALCEWELTHSGGRELRALSRKSDDAALTIMTVADVMKDAALSSLGVGDCDAIVSQWDD